MISQKTVYKKYSLKLFFFFIIAPQNKMTSTSSSLGEEEGEERVDVPRQGSGGEGVIRGLRGVETETEETGLRGGGIPLIGDVVRAVTWPE